MQGSIGRVCQARLQLKCMRVSISTDQQWFSHSHTRARYKDKTRLWGGHMYRCIHKDAYQSEKRSKRASHRGRGTFTSHPRGRGTIIRWAYLDWKRDRPGEQREKTENPTASRHHRQGLEQGEFRSVGGKKKQQAGAHHTERRASRTCFCTVGSSRTMLEKGANG
jgi:hypothetical protein